MWTCGKDSPPATVPRTSAVVAVMVLRTVSLLLDGVSLALSTRRGRGVTCHFGPSGLAASSIGSHRGVPTWGPPVSPHSAAYCGLGSSFGVEDRPFSLLLLEEVQIFGKSSLEQGTEGRLCPVSVCLETCPSSCTRKAAVALLLLLSPHLPRVGFVCKAFVSAHLASCCHSLPPSPHAGVTGESPPLLPALRGHRWPQFWALSPMQVVRGFMTI